MVKNDNAHSVRLVESLRKNVGYREADEFEEEYPLSKSAGIEKKYEWAKDAYNYLEEHFDTETIIKLRKECRCNDGKSIANKILKYLNKANSIEQFVNTFNEKDIKVTLMKSIKTGGDKCVIAVEW